MKVQIVRILGNDFPSYHGKHHAALCLDYQLTYEVWKYPGIEVSSDYLLNRVWREESLSEIENVIVDKGKGKRFKRIIFEPDEFQVARRLGNTPRILNALIGINNARNVSMEMFKNDADYLFVLDGGCCFTEEQSYALLSFLKNREPNGFVLLETIRCSILKDLVNAPVSKSFTKNFEAEAQLGWHKSVSFQFDERLPYGTADKAHVLWRLGVPGLWDNWHPELQGKYRRQPLCYSTDVAGNVNRYPVAVMKTTSSNVVRAKYRFVGLDNLIKEAEIIYG